MTNEEISKEIDIMYATIKAAEKRIEELGAECKHESTHEGWYSWRIGSMERADMCDYCDKPINFRGWDSKRLVGGATYFND